MFFVFNIFQCVVNYVFFKSILCSPQRWSGTTGADRARWTRRPTAPITGTVGGTVDGHRGVVLFRSCRNPRCILIYEANNIKTVEHSSIYVVSLVKPQPAS